MTMQFNQNRMTHNLCLCVLGMLSGAFGVGAVFTGNIGYAFLSGVDGILAVVFAIVGASQ